MRIVFIYAILLFLLISCDNCKKNPISTVEISRETFGEQYTEGMEKADIAYDDSVDYKGFNPDEYGVCEGLPDEYSAKNDAEANMIETLKSYYNALKKGNVEKAKKYIHPKVYEQTSTDIPNVSKEEVSKVMDQMLSIYAEYESFFKKTFEGYKKSTTLVYKLYKLPSKDECLLYSVHYSIAIISTNDDENYYAWHMPAFVYAASKDNGKNWYLIELNEYSNFVLSEFR